MTGKPFKCVGGELPGCGTRLGAALRDPCCVALNASAEPVRVSKSQRIRELEAMVEHLQAANRCLNLEAEQLRGLLLAR